MAAMKQMYPKNLSGKTMREAMRIPYIFDFFTLKPRNIQQPFNEGKDTLLSIVDNWPACSKIKND